MRLLGFVLQVLGCVVAVGAGAGLAGGLGPTEAVVLALVAALLVVAGRRLAGSARAVGARPASS